MGYKIIPLTTDPDQNFKCTLPVDGKNLNLYFRLRYNTEGDCWIMTVYDSNRNILLDSIPLVTGEYPSADILGQYEYLGLGSTCVINIGNTEMDIPDATNLGTDFVLVWGDTVGSN